MYWIYLILFVFMIVTPELTQSGFLFFGEEDLESVLIFCFGIIGLVLYLGKESAFLRAVREKLSLQQETNQIRKDLSQSYSYIGEMNRRIDIVKNMVVATPTSVARADGSEPGRLYHPIFDATMLLAQSDCVGLFFVNEEDQTVLERHVEGEHLPTIEAIDGKQLMASKKYIWNEDGLTFVRSPENANGQAAFLVFHTLKNRLEETGIFQILAAQALLVFSVSRGKVSMDHH
jgi:hypothetical protein